MIIAGLLSTMNIWVDKYQDIRYSMNDVYMILLMAGWMLFFMGLFRAMRILNADFISKKNTNASS